MARCRKEGVRPSLSTSTPSQCRSYSICPNTSVPRPARRHLRQGRFEECDHPAASVKCTIEQKPEMPLCKPERNVSELQLADGRQCLRVAHPPHSEAKRMPELRVLHRRRTRCRPDVNKFPCLQRKPPSATDLRGSRYHLCRTQPNSPGRGTRAVKGRQIRPGSECEHDALRDKRHWLPSTMPGNLPQFSFNGCNRCDTR
jgi:hypothetical protein